MGADEILPGVKDSTKVSEGWMGKAEDRGIDRQGIDKYSCFKNGMTTVINPGTLDLA